MLTIFYSDEEIQKTKIEDQTKSSLDLFLILTEDWQLCEIMGFVNYRKIIRQYVGGKV